MIMAKMLKVHTVHDYNVYVGHADLHPLVSVIDYSELPPIRHSRTKFDLYALFLRDDTLEDLTYGCSKYDYKSGTLISVAPGQIGGVEDNGETFRIEGWALLFHPELLKGTLFGKQMADFTFFSYHVNEALHMAAEEREMIISLMRSIAVELSKKKDRHQDGIIVGYIELILKFCMRFYDRQFYTRKVENNDILARLESLLFSYYKEEKQFAFGLPTVSYCAKELCFSPNYFSDLVRRVTSESATDHIRSFIVNMAKNRMMNGESISQIAYGLGFDYPQHMSRFFKKQTGETPSDYIKRIRGNDTELHNH